MSVLNYGSSHRLTPRNKVSTPARWGRDDDNVRLSLRRVIGTTASSAGAVDYLPEQGIVATTCGSVVTVSQLDENLNITQRVFRTGPNATALNTSTSYYNPSSPTGFRDLAVRHPISKDGATGVGISTSFSDLVADSPGRTKASSRTRSASCLSLSYDGRLLAIGEVGVAPRINVFSLADDVPSDTPLSTISEHSNFGIRLVAFAPDSQWLCSLGNINDGFIFLWSISKNGSARLHASNKCVSSVHGITWMGNSVITVGTRHVKVWRVDQAEPSSPTKGRAEMIKNYDLPPSSPVPKIFSGRNCLLGPLIDAVFTSVVAISQEKAIVCTEDGDICLLDDSDQSQRLERRAHVNFKIHCVSVGPSGDCIVVGGSEGKIKILSIYDLEKSERMPDPINSSSRSSPASQYESLLCDFISIGFLGKDRICTLDSRHSMCIFDTEKVKAGGPTDFLKQVAAHDSAVRGVSALQRPNKQAADFFTWSSQGTALFWTADGSCSDRFEIPLAQEAESDITEVNELRVLRASSSGDFFVFGDRYGNIGAPSVSAQTVKAHSGEVNDVAIAQREDGCLLVASCGRDRILQLFQMNDKDLELLQTMEGEHTASVSSILFLDHGSTLLSASADRTVVIRTIASVKGQCAAFVPVRTLTLRSSPVCLASMPGEPKILVVSTMDRQLLKYDLQSGHLVQSFKASDLGGSDSVTVSAMAIGKLDDRTCKTPLIFAVSANDRSIRAYDSATGGLLAREHGQLAISDVAIVRSYDQGGSEHQVLVSTGLDGTVMIWEISSTFACQKSSESINNHLNLLGEHPRSSQPLKRVLSKSELLELQKLLDSEPSTPTRNYHTARVRKRPSRVTLANTPKENTPKAPRSTRHSPSSSALDANHQLTREPSPTRATQKVDLASRTKRFSPDTPRQRHLEDLQSSEVIPFAENLCGSLRGFRERLERSTEKLEAKAGEDLERELAATIQVVGRKTQKSQHASIVTSAKYPTDGWLVRLIDERLSLRLGDSKVIETQDEEKESENA